MTKRHISIINRISEESKNDSWLEQVDNNLKRNAVQPRSVDDSLFNQMNSIMNGTKSKHSTVQAAVEDMKERSGYSAFQKKINKLSEDDFNNQVKTAQDKNKTPIIFKKKPEIENTIKTYVKETNGNISVPAIKDHIMSIYRTEKLDPKDWEDPLLLAYLISLNLQEKAKHNNNSQENNLGKLDKGNNTDIDISNSDAFSALNPVKF
jgi:hypothetical protein